MPSGFRLLRPEGRTETIYSAERRSRSFIIQLTALRQIAFVAMIVDFKQVRCAFAGCRCNDRRVRKHKVVAIKEFAQGKFDFRPYPQNRRLFGSTDPKMAALRQEFDAMFFQADRILAGDADRLHLCNVNFIAAGGPRFGPDCTPQIQRTFLGQCFGSGKSGFVGF